MVANQYLECRYNKTFRQLQNYKKVSQKNNCSPKRIVQNSIRGTLLSLSDNYQDYATHNRTNWRLQVT